MFKLSGLHMFKFSVVDFICSQNVSVNSTNHMQETTNFIVVKSIFGRKLL